MLKKAPSVVQLPGGIKLQGVSFRVVAYNDDGSPKTFELLPRGDESSGRGIWTLFASEDAIRRPVAERDR